MNVENGFLVECADEKAKDLVSRWLSHSYPVPPTRLILRIEVGTVGATPTGFHEVFRQPETVFFVAPGDILRIEWESRPAFALLDKGYAASVTLSPEAADDLESATTTFFAAVVMMLFRRVGWHHLHAAMLEDPSGRGWLMAGNSASGKSTTTAFLNACGWGVGGDDGCFLSRKKAGLVVRPVRKKIALRPGGQKLLSVLGGEENLRRGKREFSVDELRGARLEIAVPEIVAFLSVEGSKTTIERVAGSEVLSEFVRWSAWVALEPVFAQDHLEMLAGLGRQADCYRLRLATDLFDHPDLLLEATT